MPRLSLLWVLVLGTTLVAYTRAGENAKARGAPAPKCSAQAIFDRLKTLEGQWVAASSNEHVKKGQVVLRYQLTGGGTALTETILPGTPMEMLSVYHRDGEQLVITHYCCLGNQPRMRAKPGASPDEIVFEFIGGANIDPARDRHLHGGRIRIVDAHHLHSECDFYVNGKLAESHSLDVIRQK